MSDSAVPLPAPYAPATGDRDPRRFVWPVVGVIGVFLVAAFVVNAWTARDQVLAGARRNAANIALLLERQVTGMMNVADLLSRTVGALGDGPMPDEIARSVSDISYVEALHVLDAGTGTVIRDTQGLPQRHPGIIDLEALQAAPRMAASGVRVGPPVRTQSGWSFGLSRKVSRPGGEVLVVAHVSLARIESLFQAVDTGPDGCISLFNPQGLLMSTSPPDPSQIGRDLSKTVVLARIREHGARGEFSETNLSDGIDRLVSFGTIEPAGLVVAVGVSQDVALAAWRSQVARDGGFILLLLSLILCGGLLTDRLLRRRAEAVEALKRNETFLRGILEASGDCIQVLDGQGRLTFINGSGLSALEVEDFDQYDGRRYLTLFPAEAQASVQAALRQAREEGTGRVTAPCPTAKGTLKWWDVMITPIGEAAGRDDRMVAISRDVTDQRRVADELFQAKHMAEEATRAKTDFLSAMSHEVRTPLNGILGITDILLKTHADSRTAELLRHQAEAGHQLLGIISNVLDWTKIEEGRLELRKAPVPVSQIVETCIGMLAPSAENKGVVVDSEVDEALPRNIVVDALRVQQVVLNFLSNGIRHSERGTVRLVARPSPAGGIRFSVTDSGPGIPRGREHLLFQKFSQISPSGGGSGLGLAIAKRLAETMGGAVGFVSDVGQGATFWLDLPLDVPALPCAAPRIEAAEPAGDIPPARVLVAEDTPLNRMVIEAMLREGGHEVVMVENGARAVEAVREGTFDIVFMDVMMPVLDGLDATRAIRSLPDPQRDVPIVALTANSFADEVNRCLQSGMDAHLAKPVDAAALTKEIRQRVRRREPIRSCA